MIYTVARVETPDGVFFTARKDDRTADEIVAHGVQGYERAKGDCSNVYKSLYHYRTCTPTNVSTGLDKLSANAVKKQCIFDARANNENVLNGKSS